MIGIGTHQEVWLTEEKYLALCGFWNVNYSDRMASNHLTFWLWREVGRYTYEWSQLPRWQEERTTSYDFEGIRDDKTKARIKWFVSLNSQTGDSCFFPSLFLPHPWCEHFRKVFIRPVVVVMEEPRWLCCIDKCFVPFLSAKQTACLANLGQYYV